MQAVRSVSIGRVTASIINIGNVYLPLAPNMNVPRTELGRTAELRDLAAQTLIPIHCIHLRVPGTSVLVDAGAYTVEPDSEYAVTDYVPPPGLAHQLATVGVSPEDVEHVVITHRHWDHFNGTTVEEGDQFIPRFPRARYYLGHADWDRGEKALRDPGSVEYRTLRVLHDDGKLDLVVGNRALCDEVQILEAPGETLGHQIVRVHSNGQTLYCMGDLYHHPVEFAHPEWLVAWARPVETRMSREALVRAAVEERALLVATHIPAIGQLRATAAGGVEWKAVDLDRL